jgi:hypothetical protein
MSIVRKCFTRSRLALVAFLAIPLGIALGAPIAAQAAPSSISVSTQVSNRPDSGNGGTWAYDTFKRTLTVTRDVSLDAAAPEGDVGYTATVHDLGSFSAIQGNNTPNQVVPGTKIAHHVNGSMSGGISYVVYAPSADALTGVVPATEDDNFGSALVTTGNWPKQVFATSVGVTVTENNDWGWTYKTACEQWVDSASNGDGNLVADGNITGKICTPHLPPFVYAGHVITVNNNRASVGWSESPFGWPNDGNGKCEEVRIFGFGFTVNGSPHIGFTCDHGTSNTNVGFLTGLTPGHNYFLQVVPAQGTYGNHHPIPGVDLTGGIDVLTTS